LGFSNKPRFWLWVQKGIAKCPNGCAYLDLVFEQLKDGDEFKVVVVGIACCFSLMDSKYTRFSGAFLCQSNETLEQL